MDEEGAGDWTSATFIHLLTAHGVRHMADLSATTVPSCWLRLKRRGLRTAAVREPRTDEIIKTHD